MKSMFWAVFVVVLTSSALVCAKDESAESDDPLATLDFLTGNWTWEGTIRLHGKEPEHFRWRFDSERTLDGRFFLEKCYDVKAGYKLVHLSLVGWCDKEKAIKGWGFWAPPSSPHEVVVYTKTEDGWRITRDGLDGTLTRIDNDQWKYDAKFERDGAENHWGFTARRLKSPTEADATKAIDTLKGQWALTVEEGGVTSTAKVTATPTSSKLALRLIYQVPGEQPANGMFAWHATKKQIVETWFRGGEHVRICFDGITDDGTLFGPGEGMLEGKRFAGLRMLKFHSSESYTHTIRDNTSEGEPQPDVTISAARIVSKPVE